MEGNKLRGRIVEIYGTQDKFAEKLGVTPATVSQKLKIKRELTRREISTWAELLNIPPEEIYLYFFSE